MAFKRRDAHRSLPELLAATQESAAWRNAVPGLMDSPRRCPPSLAAEHQMRSDVRIELPTGTGKTFRATIASGSG